MTQHPKLLFVHDDQVVVLVFENDVPGGVQPNADLAAILAAQFARSENFVFHGSALRHYGRDSVDDRLKAAAPGGLRSAAVRIAVFVEKVLHCSNGGLT